MRNRSIRGALRRAGPGLAAALAAVTLAGALTPPASVAAHPGLPSPIFDPDEVSWASIRDRNLADFNARVAEYTRAGFLVIDIDADLGPEGPVFAAVFQRNLDGRAFRVEPMMTEAQFHQIFDDEKRAGRRLVDWETFVADGRRFLAAVWVRNVEGYGWSFRWGMTDAEANAYYQEMKAAGMMPVDVNLYPSGTDIRFATAWVRNAEGLGWFVHRHLTRSEYDKKLEEYRQAGYRSLVFDSALTAEGQLYAGIWVKNANQRRWWVRSDRTGQGFANWWHRYADEGYRLINEVRYETAGGIRYAGIWRQNSARPDWPLRADLDATSDFFQKGLGVPGLSVAVVQDGQLRYLRGFGDADIDNGVWLDGTHVMRIASVSKAVGGVLTQQLAEQGDLDPDDPLANYVFGLPAHHTYTIEEVVSNRGCVRHYAWKEKDDGYPVPQSWYDEDAELASNVYGSAWQASKVFWDGPLVCTVGTSHYSTPGYTLLAAGLQQAGGALIDDLIVDELTGPYALGTLRPEDLTDTSVRRSVYYDGSNLPIADLEEVSWKRLGGGLESSVRDLAFFGDKLLGEQILTGTSLDAMWVDTGWGYAYGWTIDTEDGHRRVGKNGGAQGGTAYLQLYPDDGITIAVLMNRDDGDAGQNWAEALGKLIGSEILSTLP